MIRSDRLERSLISRVKRVVKDGSWGAPRNASAAGPIAGLIVRTAAMRYVRKRTGSLSSSSSDSHATRGARGWGLEVREDYPSLKSLASSLWWSSQAAISVVLQKPAGAAIRVSLRANP